MLVGCRVAVTCCAPGGAPVPPFGTGFSISTSNLVTPDTTDPQWQHSYFAGAGYAPSVSVGAGGYASVNPAHNSPPTEIRVFEITCPATGTWTFTWMARLKAGDASGTLTLGILNHDASAQLAEGVITAALSSVDQTFTRDYALTAGTRYLVYASSNQSSQFGYLVAPTVGVAPKSGSGVWFTQPFARIALRGVDWIGNAEPSRYGATNDVDHGCSKPSPSSVVEFVCDSATIYGEFVNTSTTSTYEQVALEVDGVFAANTGPLAAKRSIAALAGTVSGKHKYRLITGPSGLSGTSTIGCWPQALYVFGATVLYAQNTYAAVKNVAFVGDSIDAGQAALVGQGFVDLLLRDGHCLPHNKSLGSAGIGTYVVDSATATAFATALSSLGVAFDAIVILSVTNDYGLAIESAANHQVYLGLMVDAIHTQMPAVPVIIGKSLHRTDMTGANSFGNVLADYDAARAAVVAARTGFCSTIDPNTAGAALAGDGLHLSGAGHVTIEGFYVTALGLP